MFSPAMIRLRFVSTARNDAAKSPNVSSSDEPSGWTSVRRTDTTASFRVVEIHRFAAIGPESLTSCSKIGVV